jgi:hypothetical protein
MDPSSSRTRPRRLVVRLERWILSTGMGVMAFVIERRLLRALKQGGVTSAPRTAAGHGALDDEAAGPSARSWEVTPRTGGLTAAPREDA